SSSGPSKGSPRQSAGSPRSTPAPSGPGSSTSARTSSAGLSTTCGRSRPESELSVVFWLEQRESAAVDFPLEPDQRPEEAYPLEGAQAKGSTSPGGGGRLGLDRPTIHPVPRNLASFVVEA